MKTTTTRSKHRIAGGLQFRRALVVLFAGLCLASCTTSFDENQARACRAVLPALHENDARLNVQAIKPGPVPRSIRIDYRARGAIGPERGHFLLCIFAEDGLGQRKTDIVALRTEHGAISGASLYLMKRFWLEQAEAELSLPQAPPLPPLLGAWPGPVVNIIQHAASALPMIAITALLAAAYALIYGLAGRILLVFGEFALLGAAGTSFGVAVGEAGSISTPSLLLSIGLIAALWCSLWASTVSARAAILPVLDRPGHHVIIVSVGLALALGEAVRLTQGTGRRWLSPVWNNPLSLAQSADFSATITPSALGVTATAAALATALLIFMNHSGFGRAWRAASDDPLAASILGVNVRRLVTMSFILAAMLAAMAGFLLSVHIGGMGYSGAAVFGLKALVGAILGGIGSIGGALAGGLLLGLMEAAWPVFMPIEWRDVFVFALLSILLVLRPGGIFGYGALSPREV